MHFTVCPYSGHHRAQGMTTVEGHKYQDSDSAVGHLLPYNKICLLSRCLQILGEMCSLIFHGINLAVLGKYMMLAAQDPNLF